MGALTVVNFLSVDGVMQGPLDRDEDVSGGFTGGGWVADRPDDVVAEFMQRTTLAAGAMLLGRRTYEAFDRVWSRASEDNPAVAAMNRMTKFVASTTLRSTTWTNTVILNGDVSARVDRLRQEPGPDIVVFGSSVLVKTLIEGDLVDRYQLLVYPVVLGAGKRMFPTDRGAQPLQLLASVVAPSGVVIQTYERHRQSPTLAWTDV